MSFRKLVGCDVYATYYNICNVGNAQRKQFFESIATMKSQYIYELPLPIDSIVLDEPGSSSPALQPGAGLEEPFPSISPEIVISERSHNRDLLVDASSRLPHHTEEASSHPKP